MIVAALAGHDVFVQAATSFGKSLCFQLPAVIDHGSKGASPLIEPAHLMLPVTIVISPLLSLMVNTSTPPILLSTNVS